MLRTLKDLFVALAAPPGGAPAASREHTLQLATAVLLVEVMRSDAQIRDDERAAVLGALRQTFALADDEIARLVELAERTARDAHDLHTFTSTLTTRTTRATSCASSSTCGAWPMPTAISPRTRTT